jgi:hypothetical protein
MLNLVYNEREWIAVINIILGKNCIPFIKSHLVIPAQAGIQIKIINNHIFEQI